MSVCVVCVYVYMCVCMYVCVYVRIQECVCICMCSYVYGHITMFVLHLIFSSVLLVRGMLLHKNYECFEKNLALQSLCEQRYFLPS